MNPLSRCARIAADQFGLIERRQAISAGVSPDAIDRLLRARAWSRIHPRVYALWVRQDTWRHLLLAGTLWLGPRSAVSHRAAVVLHELDGIDSAPIEFASMGNRRLTDRRQRRRLVVHRVRQLPDADIELRANIPVTSVTRTLIDLGSVAGRREVALAMESALRKGLTSPKALWARYAELPARSTVRGSVLWQLLDERPAVATESALEVLTWRLLLDGGLEAPQRQHEIFGPGGRLVARVDFAYPAAKLAIEADSYAYHSDRTDWQRDRTKQNTLIAIGWVVYRVTWRDVTRRGGEVIREVASLLGRRLDLPVPAMW